MQANLNFMRRAFALAEEGMRAGKGEPFGAVVVKDGKIIGEGFDEVTSTNDPTAHAEIVALRAACKVLDSHALEGCEIYCSLEPCVMCLHAIHSARIKHIYYGKSLADAAGSEFGGDRIRRQAALGVGMHRIPVERIMAGEAAMPLNKRKAGNTDLC